MSSNIRINRVCNYCNQKFVAKNFTTKYCSHKCNQRDYKRRIKEERIKTIRLGKKHMIPKSQLDNLVN